MGQLGVECWSFQAVGEGAASLTSVGAGKGPEAARCAGPVRSQANMLFSRVEKPGQIRAGQ